MIWMQNLPLWVALPAALLVVVGSTLTLLGTLGLVTLKSFYDRLHAPTLGTSWGTAAILLASMLVFGDWPDRWTLIGAAIIAVGGVLVALPQRRR